MGKNQDKSVSIVSQPAWWGFYYFIFWGTGPPAVQVVVSKQRPWADDSITAFFFRGLMIFNILVQKRITTTAKSNAGSELENDMTKGPEFVIPAQAGIQALAFNDRNPGCPLSRA